MQALLSRDDFQLARSFIRWVSIGVQPSAERAGTVQEILRVDSRKSLTAVEEVVDQASRGVLASTDLCFEAEMQLDLAYREPDEGNVLAEQHHG